MRSVPVLQMFHRLGVFELVVPYGREGIVQGFHDRSWSLMVSARMDIVHVARVHAVQHVPFLLRVVPPGDHRRGLSPQEVPVPYQESIVRDVRLLLHGLIQVVGQDGVAQVQEDDHPVVEECDVLGHEAVRPLGVAAQFLHDEQMVELVPRFGKVHLEQVGAPPQSQRLEQVQDGQVAEVGHAGDRLQGVKSGVLPVDRLTRVQRVKEIRFEGVDQFPIPILGGLVERSPAEHSSDLCCIRAVAATSFVIVTVTVGGGNEQVRCRFRKCSPLSDTGGSSKSGR
jgi:hypothetical protein